MVKPSKSSNAAFCGGEKEERTKVIGVDLQFVCLIDVAMQFSILASLCSFGFYFFGTSGSIV